MILLENLSIWKSYYYYFSQKSFFCKLAEICITEYLDSPESLLDDLIEETLDWENISIVYRIEKETNGVKNSSVDSSSVV